MSHEKIANPVLKGFNPDPSICRVGKDFYLATSTFEWYPGIQIHHSRDLANWQLISRPLNSERLLDMTGVPDSCGVWAPCLTNADGQFWLAYTVVNRFDGNFKDTHNFLVTARDIHGPWSDPVHLNSSGFDPSLFHDRDGRKWWLNMVWDHRPDRSFFNGILAQEYDHDRQGLRGEPRYIFRGTGLDCTEGPHLYRIGGYYYLVTAEGGTGYGHAVTVARSRDVTGPYEPDPNGPLVTARDHPDWPLQRTGHGDLVQLEDGNWYLVFLCSRRSERLPHSPMGRETAIQPVEFTDDGWIRLVHGGVLPQLEITAPDLPAFEVTPPIEQDDFDEPELDIAYQWLRTPRPDAFSSLKDRPGHLRLYGMESPGSWFRQALIARRQTDPVFVAETSLDFNPTSFQNLAGLILYYNASKFHYLFVSRDEQAGKYIGIMSCQADPGLETVYPVDEPKIPVPEGLAIRLRMQVDHEQLRFSWSAGEEGWRELPVVLDVRYLTDQAGREEGEQFTGAFIGLCAHDLTGQRTPADFDYLAVRAVKD